MNRSTRKTVFFQRGMVRLLQHEAGNGLQGQDFQFFGLVDPSLGKPRKATFCNHHTGEKAIVTCMYWMRILNGNPSYHHGYPGERTLAEALMGP